MKPVNELIARYEEGGSFPKPRSWANCDELGSPYQFFPRYGVSNAVHKTYSRGYPAQPGTRAEPAYICQYKNVQSTLVQIGNLPVLGLAPVLISGRPGGDCVRLEVEWKRFLETFLETFPTLPRSPTMREAGGVLGLWAAARGRWALGRRPRAVVGP